MMIMVVIVLVNGSFVSFYYVLRTLYSGISNSSRKKE